MGQNGTASRATARFFWMRGTAVALLIATLTESGTEWISSHG
jgi:hypothetical protein